MSLYTNLIIASALLIFLSSDLRISISWSSIDLVTLTGLEGLTCLVSSTGELVSFSILISSTWLATWLSLTLLKLVLPSFDGLVLSLTKLFLRIKSLKLS